MDYNKTRVVRSGFQMSSRSGTLYTLDYLILTHKHP